MGTAAVHLLVRAVEDADAGPLGGAPLITGLSHGTLTTLSKWRASLWGGAQRLRGVLKDFVGEDVLVP